ncbi:MAG TPA: MFS transporter [Gemmatimonadales bacterium]|jgi:ACS family glucarate transporter-like MFS transporter
MSSTLTELAPEPTPEVVHHPGPSSVRWIILALLFAASVVAYVLRTNMSVAGEAMSRDVGLSQLQLGLVLAAFAWGYAIFQFPGGVLGDRLGGRRSLTLIAIAWGVLNLLVGLTPKAASPSVILAALISLRFLMGVAQAPVYPVTSGGTTCNWFPIGGWALPNGLSNAGLAFGSAATGPLIAWLTETMGWRQSFVVTAPLAFLLAAIWWWYVRDYPAEHSGVRRDELALINAKRPPHYRTAPEPGAWRRVLRNRDVLLLTASYFCSNYVFYIFFNWLFIYLVENRGFQSLQSGYLAAAPWIAGAVGAVAGGIGCDWLCRRIGFRWGCRWPSVVGLLLAAGLIVLAATAKHPYLAVLFLSLCLCFQQATEGAFWAATIAVSGGQASAACGVLNTGGNVVGGVGALLVPVIVRSLGWPAALSTASVFAVVAAALWMWIRADRQLGD